MAQDKKAKKKQPTALKRALQSEQQRLINRVYRSRVRTTMNGFEDSLKTGDAAAIQEQLSAVHSMIDKGVKRGVFHANKVARTKSRFAARAQAAAK